MTERQLQLRIPPLRCGMTAKNATATARTKADMEIPASPEWRVDEML
jgi:hypothetical protein